MTQMYRIRWSGNSKYSDIYPNLHSWACEHVRKIISLKRFLFALIGQCKQPSHRC